MLGDHCLPSRGSVASENCILGEDENRSDVVDLSNSSVRISPEQTLYFDLLGRPVDANNKRLCTTEDCKFTFKQGDSTASICLNSEGFIDAC